MAVVQEVSVVKSLLSAVEKTPLQQVHDVYVSATPSARADIVSLLFGKVFLAAPPPEKGLLIKQLMRPLGLCSVAGIANGAFASIRFQGSFNNLQPRLEDIQAVQEQDVVALASHVQQVSAHALNGMGQILTSSPALAGSAAAIVLIKILMDRAKSSRDDDSRIHSVPHFPERRAQRA